MYETFILIFLFDSASVSLLDKFRIDSLISDTVFSPRIASKATLALNSARYCFCLLLIDRSSEFRFRAYATVGFWVATSINELVFKLFSRDFYHIHINRARRSQPSKFSCFNFEFFSAVGTTTLAPIKSSEFVGANGTAIFD